jgi:two-component system, chemotaxis family, CheB/CheR fusion protein
VKAKEKKILSPNIFPVVGIGASAGGLDAFKKLIKAIPEDSGMAFVLVQHLDPKHESMLPELLQKVTNIPVLEISDDIKVQPNHIYIIPSNKMMIANDGVLQLSPRTAKKNERNLPVDLFFTSLAEVHQSHSIGVVLSGTASDGTKGLKAIKDHGGITLAQSEESAAYDGMPHSAIQAGVVDFILPPEQIPQKLLEIAKIANGHGGESENIPKPAADVFKQILLLLRIRKGTDFTYYKQPTLLRRIFRRMALNKNEEPADYLKFLREHKEEQDVLYQDLLIPVTSFFRDPKSFDHLCETVFPSLIKSKVPGAPIRVWVAGCSTGQEVYSIAICLTEFLGSKERRGAGGEVQIFATDISEPAIAKARTGIYAKSELDASPTESLGRGLSPQRLQEFFTKTNGGYQVNKSIRDRCVFAVHNFIKDPPFGKLDLISCRNVLIYMEPYLQKKALTTFHYSLNNHGFLLLGKSETIASVPDLFAQSVSKAHKGDKLFSRKDVPGKYIHTATLRTEQGITHLNEPDKSGRTVPIAIGIQKTADDILLTKYTPAGVVINEAMDIVHFRGKTSPYLEQLPGKPSHNLLKMAKNGLAFELRNILHKTKKDKAPVTKENIPIQVNGTHHTIAIEAMPLPDTIEPHYLILFHERAIESRAQTGAKRVSKAKREENGKDLKIAQLEKELAQAREDMRSITEDQEAANEELQSANEELLSGSEELQSLNEELETGKEELQSTNEELSVVNQEMISLNEQVTTAKDYAEAIIENIREPLLVMDKNLRVQTANDAFYKTFHTHEKETIGVLIYDLGHKQWNIAALRTLLEKILPEKSTFNDFEVTHTFSHAGERVMLLNAREVVNKNSSEKSILLSIEDITGLKKAQKILETSGAYLRQLVKGLPAAVYSCDASGHINFYNDAALKVWGRVPDLGKDQWCGSYRLYKPDGSPLALDKSPMALAVKEGRAIDGEEIIIERPDGTRSHVLVYPQPEFGLTGEITGAINMGFDITEQVLARKKIEESEARFRNLVEKASSPICILKGEDMILTVANEAVFKVWNVGKEMLGKPFLEIVPEMKDQPFIKYLLAVLNTGTPHYGNEEPSYFIRANGEKETVYFNFVYQPYHEVDGTISGVMVLATDVTEQVLARKKIEESEERFRALADESPMFVFILEPTADATVNYWNKTWRRYTGQTNDESLGRSWDKIIHPDDVEDIMAVYGLAFEERQPFFLPYVRVKRHDGEYRWHAVNANPRYLTTGEFIGFIGVGYDVHEQKLAEQALTASEAFNRGVLENSPDCVKIIDVGGHIQYMNTNGICAMEIDDFETVKDKPWSDLWGEDNKKMVADAVDKALSGGSAQFQAYCPTTKGTPKWWDVIVNPMHESGNNTVTNIISVSRDITEQRAIQSLLEYRKALLEAHNEAGVDGILLVDAKARPNAQDGRGKILSYNKRFIEIWNMPQHIVDAKDDDAALEHAASLLVNPEQFNERVQYLYNHPLETSKDLLEFKDGKIVERHGYPVMAPDGGYYAWSWTFRDITQVKLAEKALKASERKFMQMAELVPEKVWTADSEGNKTYFNQTLLDYAGLSFDELKGEGWQKIIHPDDWEKDKVKWFESLRTGKVYETENRLLRKDGKYLWHLTRAVPVKDEDDKIKLWIGSKTEMQEQKEHRIELEKAVIERTHELVQANIQVEQKNEDLVKMNSELQSFTYIASHDLQEPLRKIQTFAKRIVEKDHAALSENGKDYFLRMQQAAGRMQTLIEDLLAFSRVNSGDRNYEHADLTTILDEVKNDFKEIIEEKNAVIETHGLGQAYVIPFQFHQLLQNLLGNALKFTKPNTAPHISIKSEIAQGSTLHNRLLPEKEYCHITMSDNGIGFEPEFKDKIFELFQQLHGKDKFKGTGIGLSIVKKIVENHHGIVTATGELGIGARFDIYIPNVAKAEAK